MKYEVEGAPFPYVTVSLEYGESIRCQTGAMSWMTPNLDMSTDAKGGGSRLLTGESIFQTTYTAKDLSGGTIAFSSDFPGEIRAIDLSREKEIVMQSGAFLASVGDVSMKKFFQKRLMTGLAGGEGFIMERLFGSGIVFAELDGCVKEYTLQPQESMIVSTGYLAMMSATCKLDVERVRGMKNIWIGREGWFNAKVEGPGSVWVQSMPIRKLAGCIQQYLPSTYKQNSTTSGSSGSSFLNS